MFYFYFALFDYQHLFILHGGDKACELNVNVSIKLSHMDPGGVFSKDKREKNEVDQ